jgi:hypothetical protein
MSFEKFDFANTATKKTEAELLQDVVEALKGQEVSVEPVSELLSDPNKEENLWPAQHDPRKGMPDNVKWSPAKIDTPTPERRTME